MADLGSIRHILNVYKNKNLNEADTRFKVIDQILDKALDWPKDKTACEVFLNGNRADYVLYNRNSKPLLVIEAKKSNKYFELPTNINSKKNYQTILVEKLLTDQLIKDAIFQVKEYAEDIGSSFACITNGKVWIFFQVFGFGGSPWKKLPAFVIRNLDFFHDDYSFAYNFLGYENILLKSSLKLHVGFIGKSNVEVFYPKKNISAYDTPVNSNVYASLLNSIAREYLGNIPFDDKKFFNKCYVINKGHFDDLQKTVHGIIHDSLTPFFRNDGVEDFRDDGNGGKFAKKIQDTIVRQNLDNVMILFGGRGSGKSTFIKRLLYHIKPQEITRYGEIAVVDLIDSSQNSEELSEEIWRKLQTKIDSEGILRAPREILLALFQDRFAEYKRQMLDGLPVESVEYHRLLTNFISDNKKDIKYCCERLSFNWKSKGKGLIIVLDNMDQLLPELQDVCFLNAVEIAKKLKCLVVISMREERYFNAKSKGVLDAYHIPGFHLTSPVIPEVIMRRLTYAINEIKEKDDGDVEFGIGNINKINTIFAFLEICIAQLKRKHSPLGRFLRYSTHGDVRQALDFFKGFLTSGYTNVNEMAPHPNWAFQIHQVVKPMMIPDRFFYDERFSKMANLYQLRDESNSSHFSGLRILSLLEGKSMDKLSYGFMDVKFLVQVFETNYDLKLDCEKHLDIFLQKGIIEANNRLEEFSDKIDQVRITAFGNYLLSHLAMDFTYLDLVSLDCGLFSESLNSLFIKSAERELAFFYDRDTAGRLNSRLKRVEKFIEYLQEQETKEIERYNLSEKETLFARKMHAQFTVQKDRIIQSAKHNITED